MTVSPQIALYVGALVRELATLPAVAVTGTAAVSCVALTKVVTSGAQAALTTDD